MTPPKNLGANANEGTRLLLAYLERTGGNASALARTLDISRQRVAYWLNGYGRPTVPMSRIIQRETGVPIEAWVRAWGEAAQQERGLGANDAVVPNRKVTQ